MYAPGHHEVTRAAYDFRQEMNKAFNNGELYEWLEENALSVDCIMVDPYDRLHVIGCVVVFTLGGPTVSVNTLDDRINYHWGASDVMIYIDDKLADAITNYYA